MVSVHSNRRVTKTHFLVSALTSSRVMKRERMKGYDISLYQGLFRWSFLYYKFIFKYESMITHMHEYDVMKHITLHNSLKINLKIFHFYVVCKTHIDNTIEIACNLLYGVNIDLSSFQSLLEHIL